jgi:hypothetical protein
MELYEIIRSEVLEYHGRLCYTARTSVVTSTMDKDMAEKMLEIYKYNQSDNESYDIRTLRMPGKIVEL